MDTGNKFLFSVIPMTKSGLMDLEWQITDKDAADPSKWKGENKPRYHPLCNQRQ